MCFCDRFTPPSIDEDIRFHPPTHLRAVTAESDALVSETQYDHELPVFEA